MAINWDEHAEHWDTDEATSIFAEEAYSSLIKTFNIKGKHVLDFGCGTGLLSQKMSPEAKDIVALDYSEAMIEQLDNKALPNVEAVVDTLTRGLVAIHPAFRNQFDLVVASSVCGFLTNYVDTCDIVYSLLEEGGHFIHWDWLAVEPEEEMAMDPDYVERVLLGIGFKQVETTVPFEITTKQGVFKVMMAVAVK
ncbi:class I SAM-dependent DNA methyltransferase [Vibrio panuliri]|uniref:SAM-dependent methyltransferase n=1 Tax=Vibrio panuliri TaxID=1381081 RepID=A0A1Q9HRM5_9VIBR|nr:methyltransferase domain-containing protein [Vibrio panuliri]KAB1457141.1 methyltransferase domain-containing protein [Vibrio panuliri]OLQ87632.1 SAM-dependent methyltransferase [Vibrio panuliri]OLQ93519.1 SAM-dependent methyltransferase [Vibrio panuliri]